MRISDSPTSTVVTDEGWILTSLPIGNGEFRMHRVRKSTLSVAGPAGPTGSTGPAGAVGPAGATGPAGPPGSGTVTSVGLALPASLFTVSGSPVTVAGTLTGAFVAQTQGFVFAAPTGGAGAPSFRALVTADLPDDINIAGVMTARNYIAGYAVLTYAASVDLDFDGPMDLSLSLAGNVTFTTSNRAVVKTVSIRILADGSTRTFTFPAWRFLGTAPASIVANKVAVLTIKSYGATDADVVASYKEED